MIDVPNTMLIFPVELARLSPDIAMRAECEGDEAFLASLFIACSPLKESLPPFMLEQQAQFQRIGHIDAFPNAARWIVCRGAEPIGRMMIDWNFEGESHLVDIALLPARQGEGVGTALLMAWIAASDALGRGCSLQVSADNKAQTLYRRLGFVGSGSFGEPNIGMRRAVSA